MEINFYCIHIHKKKTLDNDIFEYLRILEDSGAGEILLSSVDNDGLMKGFEMELIKKFIKQEYQLFYLEVVEILSI